MATPHSIIELLMRHLLYNWILHWAAFFAGMFVSGAYIFSESAPWLLGKVGEISVAIGTLFPLWLGLMMLGYGWYMIGIRFFHHACWAASGPRGLVINPGGHWIGGLSWSIGWPIVIPVSIAYFYWTRR